MRNATVEEEEEKELDGGIIRNQVDVGHETDGWVEKLGGWRVL